MNYILCQKRQWPLIQERLNNFDDTSESDHEFIFELSVFKNWKSDSVEDLENMFENDFNSTKIPKVVSWHDKHDLQDVKEVLFDNYVRLKRIYDFEAANGSYPIMSNFETREYSKRCNFSDGNEEGADSNVDLAFIAVNANKPTSIRTKADLHWFEFLEFIVRIAYYKYKHTKRCSSLSSAVQTLI